ncbi:LLGL2 domain-containing protein [Phthorimaea operculella]|nr:LLGL2 domain-containing protein [Phthorimaea operculella]
MFQSHFSESLVIFSGGLPTDKAGRTHSITVLNGKSTTVLEMEHAVVDFVTLCESPHTHDYQEPYAIVVLLQNDLVVIDLLSPGYPCFENPYPMDIHESPVTCCSYFADCPSDLIPAFYSVGRAGNKKAAGFSDKLWPVNGGEWAPASCSYSEIILTGHADGSVKFWDASAGTLQILYKLKCSKVFERNSTGGYGTTDDSPLSIQQTALCAESRRLAVALPHGHVLLFKFRKAETTAETHVLEIPVISEALEEEGSPEADAGGGRSMSFSRGEATEGESRRPAIVALQHGAPHPIQALTINSSYGLMAWGGERGVVVVDVSRRVVVAALGAHALYHPAEPWARAPKQSDRQRSPSLDQLEESRASPAASPLNTGAGAEPDDTTPTPTPAATSASLDTRRKSTSWSKTFNLKRQLSKVDLKFKAAFTTPDNNEEMSIEKRNSQFYCDSEKTDTVESTNESPESDEKTAEPEESADSADRSELSSPLRVCSDVFERMHRELQEKRSSDVYDRMHKELQERWKEEGDSVVSPDISPSKLEEAPTRPDNLPLWEEDGRPTRPPRQKGKTKKEDEKRDQRLLSVPNIKYSKQEPVRDLRRRQPSPQPQSFAGNLMRRFRDLISRLCKRNEQTDETNENGEPTVEVVEVPHIIGMDPHDIKI